LKILSCFLKTIYVFLLIFTILVFTMIFVLNGRVSDNYKVEKGVSLSVESNIPLTATCKGVKLSQSSRNSTVGEMMQPILNDSLAFRQMIPFEPAEIDGYTVTALEAVHTLQPGGDRWPVIHNSTTYYRSEEALFYLIEKDGASILYAHDTDEFSPADMEFLSGKKIGLISLDCTNGSLNPDYIGHMGAEDNLRMREKLLACGAADEHTVFVANHFSHNGVCSYEQLQALMPGFVISHDSMEIHVPAR